MLWKNSRRSDLNAPRPIVICRIFRRRAQRPAGRVATRSAFAAALCMVANLLCAAPALTTIQDVLYKADGSKFNGIVQITWHSFQAADSSNIATQHVTVEVTNGYLHVMLAPTTNAATPAVYRVVYNSDGAIQFTETWVVPPSTSPLRVSDVRSTSTAGEASALSQIQITDISGLRTELNIRPTMGMAFAPSRAAVIDSSGGVAAAAGNLSDCLHVDGSSGPCGGGGASPSFADAETPTGIVDGVNTTFQLANSPGPASSLTLFRNGLALQQTVEFTISGATITFQPTSVPQPGDVLQAFYRIALEAGNDTAAEPSSTPSCTLYTLSNDGSSWTVAVNGAPAASGPPMAPAATQDIPLFALPPRGTITGVRVKTTTAWAGAGFSSFNLSIGDSAGGPAFYAAAYDLAAAQSETNFNGAALFKSATDAGSQVIAHITTDAALNASPITGAVEVDVCWVKLP